MERLVSASDGAPADAAGLVTLLDGVGRTLLARASARPLADGDNTLALIFQAHRPAPERRNPIMRQDTEGLLVRLESDKDGILSIDRYGFIQGINPVMAAMLGYGASELEDKPVRLLLPDMDEDLQGDEWRAFFDSRIERHHDHLLEFVSADGSLIRLDVQMFTGDGLQGGMTLLCRDMTLHLSAQESVFRQREQLSAIYTHATDAILLVDRRGYIENSNPVASELLALSHRRDGPFFIDDVLRIKNHHDAWVYPFSQALIQERPVVVTDDIQLVLPGRSAIPVSVTASPVRDRSNRITGCVIVLRITSESRRVSTRLSWHESHDPLTQLANRRQIENEIFRAIDHAHIDDTTHIFLYIDLHNFSVINETCDHGAGDELLRQLGRMLQEEMVNQDVVARIGNDEFAILLWDRQPEAVMDEAERILQRITAFSIPWRNRRLKVGASIGVELINADSTSEIDVLLSAGAACAAAKAAGRNKINYPSPERDSPSRASLSQWTVRISEALDENRFVVYCQPIVPVKAQRDTQHYEVLVRMVDPAGNIISPGKFIPVAETSGLIDDIDRWVFERLFTTLEALPSEVRTGYSFSVNLSGGTISDEKFRDYVVNRFAGSSLEPGLIQFEITETAAVSHFESALAFINALKAYGCAFSLDDFGSGQSSFNYLKQLPVDYLKIDGSFVRRMEVGEVEYSMVSTINHLAHIMGLATIAECVENQSQMALLEEIGVDYVQGFLISTPVPLNTLF